MWLSLCNDRHSEGNDNWKLGIIAHKSYWWLYESQDSDTRHWGFILHGMCWYCSSRWLKCLAINVVCLFEMEHLWRRSVYGYAVGSVRLNCVSMLKFVAWHTTWRTRLMEMVLPPTFTRDSLITLFDLVGFVCLFCFWFFVCFVFNCCAFAMQNKWGANFNYFCPL